MANIVIDPVTRIEGHLRVETAVSNGQVTSAWSTSPLVRGIEPILQNRDPRDAWMITQRLCGVCTYVHSAASVRCVENAVNVTIPNNARIIRNLQMGAQFIHDHIVNFYNLHLPDWVDVVSALSANTAGAVSVDQQIYSGRNRNAAYFDGVKQKLQTFVNSGQLGPFANGYWGHSAYILTPEENLVYMANYLEALSIQIQVAKMHAILGAKNPHPHSIIVGGVPLNKDLTASRISEYKTYCTTAKNFVNTYLMPDTTYLAKRYSAYASFGGTDNLMAFGEFPQSNAEPSSLFFPRGIIYNRAHNNVQPVDVANITEHINHSWYSGANLNPAQGQTVPNYTGLDTSARYSWIKAPRYQGLPVEVGPLARVMVNYGTGQSETVSAVNNFLQQAGISISQMYSTIGRTGARSIEAKVIADVLGTWANQLTASPQTYNMPFRTVFTMPTSGTGVALNEAPRGALGHWVSFSSTKITNYQMVVPSTWNFGPRDANNVPGPVETALVGTPVADQAKPVEVLRTIHSFNPCIACAVHVFDPKNPTIETKVL
jgi:[NiFe] hydrogenase large subunit